MIPTTVTTWLDHFLPKTIGGDVSFWIFFVAASIVVGLYLGRSQLVNAVLYAYISLALLQALPATSFDFSLVYGRLIVFSVTLLFLIFMGNYLFDIHISNASSDFFWRILVMSFLMVGMLLSILSALIPKKMILGFVSSGTYGLFSDPWLHVLWLAVPLLFLLFVNKRLT